MKETKDKRDRDVVKALDEAFAVMQRMEDTGDIDGFAVITQRPELGAGEPARYRCEHCHQCER